MENIQANTKSNEKKYFKRIIFVIIFLAIISIFSYINIYGEYIQIQEMGEQYLSSFKSNLTYNLYVFLVIFIVLFLLMFITTIFIKKGLKKFFLDEKKEMPKIPNKSISLIIAVIVSLIITPDISQKLVLALNPGYFGITDPVFNTDMGYYIFVKPFIEAILIYGMILVVGISIYIAVYSIVVFNKYFDGIDIELLKKNIFMKLLIINVIILALLIGGFVFVKSYDILFTNFISNEIENGLTILGAGVMEVSMKLWGYRLLSVVIIISVCMALYYMIKKNKKRALFSVLLVPIFLVVLFLLSILYDLIFVRSNEFDKEKQYISYNISNTKRAYNINIEEKEIDYSGTLTVDEMSKNQNVLKNIPIVDENVTLTTLKEYQSNVGFYSYNNIHMAMYNNTLQYLTPREILTSGSITNASKLYEYTHGYSVIVTSAVDTDEYGNVKYLQSEFNDKNTNIKITEPRIYFGLETRNNIIVNVNNHEEYDYPLTTTTNATNVYNGNAGLSLGGWDRFILGLKTRNMNMAFGLNMNEDSKILTNRQIIDRAKKVLPDILYDENPYLVVSNSGKLIWVIDGYTVTNQYPYSTSIDINYEGSRRNINYIRNSVKVTIDAYDGEMKFYIVDRDDPIIMAYNRIHPDIFVTSEESIPDDIKNHLIYPKFLYNIQSQLLASYHEIQPEVLYRNDDIWEPITYYQTIGTSGKINRIEPYYMMVDDKKLGLILPYTEYNKKNIKAYLVATYDDGNSKLLLHKFNTNVLGPIQLESQIEEDDVISAELKSISVTGTRLTKNTLIIPIANTILYVEPIYQVRLNETQIPVLKKIIVASGNKLAIGDNMKEALDNLFSQSAVSIEVGFTDDMDGLIDQIIKANNNLRTSSGNADWELMGRDVRRLQDLITQLEQYKIKLEEEDAAKKANTNTIIDNSIVSQNIIDNSINSIENSVNEIIIENIMQ